MKKSYVVVGTGGRSSMYITALAKDFSERCELKAFCDSNQKRMDFYNEYISKDLGHPPVPTYKNHDFDRMIAE